jgi:hypothetical protein
MQALDDQGHLELMKARILFNREGEQALRARYDHFDRACRLFKAASMTLESAESLLPTQSATIKGEKFWNRFVRIADERENEAERALVDSRRERRLRRS